LALTKAIFVRHGETTWNHVKRYQGHSDIPLNETGMQQAEMVARRLASEPITAVYSSDLLRAVQTAEIIAGVHALQPMVLPELREVKFGLWEGLTYEKIMAGWPELLSTAYSQPEQASIPGGESFPEVQKRAVKGLLKCIADHQEETIAVVSHGGTLRVLLCDALGLATRNMWSLRQDSAVITIVEYVGASRVVSLVNATCHLR